MAVAAGPVYARSAIGSGAKWGFALLGLLAGVALAIAIAWGVSSSLLVVGLTGPFILLLTFARPYWGVVLYVVLVYADLLSIFVRYEGAPSLTRFAGPVLLSAVFGYRLIFRREGLVSDRMTWWMILYGVMLALGLLYARSSDLVVSNLIEFTRNFITYLVVINMLITSRRLHAALWALLAMGVLLSTLTIYQSLSGRFDNDFGGLAQYRVSDIAGDTQAPRPGGTLGDANYYGQALLILLPIGFYLAFRGRSGLSRLAGWASSAALIAAIVLTYSRGDALALGVVLIGVVIYKRPRPVFWLGLILAAIVVLPLLPANYIARLDTVVSVVQGNQQTLLSEDSLRGRAGAITAAVQMFLDHPLIGVGRENYPLYQLQYLEGSGLALSSASIPPHDLYLEVAAESGIMGLIIVGGVFIVAWQALVEARRRFIAAGAFREAELAAWLGIGFLGYMVTSLFLHGAYMYILWLQIALIIAMRQLSRSMYPPALAEGESLPRSARSAPADTPVEVKPGRLDYEAHGTGRPATTIPGELRGEQAVFIFSDQGKKISVPGLFFAFWQQNGGLETLGCPISQVLINGTADKPLYTQYFENAQLEYRPRKDGAPPTVHIAGPDLQAYERRFSANAQEE